MQNATAPYRADEVGSLLRTAALKDARAKCEKGQITPDQLKGIEDEEIKKVIRKQEEVGLQLATDGEFRRSWWHFDFFWGLRGCERVVLDPPSLLRRKQDEKRAQDLYRRLNRAALEHVLPGGMLITCSCSYHVDPDTFRTTLSRAARAARRTVMLLEMRSQARDHPVLLPLSESAYLKCAVLMCAE